MQQRKLKIKAKGLQIRARGLQIGAAFGITNWTKVGLQIGAAFEITNWGKKITNQGRDYKSVQNNTTLPASDPLRFRKNLCNTLEKMTVTE